MVLQFEELTLTPRASRTCPRERSVSAAQRVLPAGTVYELPGRVWSRQQLFEQVWGPDFAGIPKNRRTHRWLREKLDTSKATQIHRHGAEGRLSVKISVGSSRTVMKLIVRHSMIRTSLQRSA